jgi:hypothetical protein
MQSHFSLRVYRRVDSRETNRKHLSSMPKANLLTT